MHMNYLNYFQKRWQLDNYIGLRVGKDREGNDAEFCIYINSDHTKHGEQPFVEAWCGHITCYEYDEEDGRVKKEWKTTTPTDTLKHLTDHQAEEIHIPDWIFNDLHEWLRIHGRDEFEFDEPDP